MQEINLTKDNETCVYSPKTGNNLTFRLADDGNLVVSTSGLEVVVPRANDDDFASGAQKVVIPSDSKVYTESNE